MRLPRLLFALSILTSLSAPSRAEDGYQLWLRYRPLDPTLATQDRAHAARLWLAAGVAGVAAFAVRRVLPPAGPLVTGALVLPLYGGLYLGLVALAGVPVPGLRRR